MASEHGISFTEFTYMRLQAHDYLWLHENMEVELQIGGSDQWGNIVSGVDLIRRVRGEAAHGLCWPLLLADDGTKPGKTKGARVWLDPQLTRSEERRVGHECGRTGRSRGWTYHEKKKKK